MPLTGDWGKARGALSRLGNLERAIDAERLLREAAEHGTQVARDSLGTYQPGWPELAASTQAERVRKGFAADEPLLRTGALRDAIAVLETTAESATFGVPSGDATEAAGLAAEHGALHEPPRPFLGPAGEQAAEELRKAVGGAVQVTITG